jgi:Tfp pilus assembly protein PilX
MRYEETKKKDSSNLQTSDFGFQKGVSLLFVVLIMSVILAMGLGISAILVQQIRMMGEIGHSVVSFYAADTGVEAQLHNLYKVASSSQTNLSDSWDNTSFSTVVKCGKDVSVEDCPSAFEVDPNCDALNFCLKSIGSYQKTKRALEITY